MTTIDKCFFCGLNDRDVISVIFDSKEIFICADCIAKILKYSDYEFDRLGNFDFTLQTPQETKHFLDDYIIGQDESKKTLAVAVYNHYKRLKYKSIAGNKPQCEINKSNILLIGDTGTGKTYLAKTLANMLNVPFCIADATSLTQAGYVGEDVEMVITRLYQEANANVSATEKGIIYIDEIDKIGRKSENPSITRDVSGEGVQQALLKIIEGTKVKISPEGKRKHPDQKLVTIDTSDILFICGGAFEGIDHIIKNRMKKQYLGFSSSNESNDIKKDDVVKSVIPEDLRKFGIIPELIGRLPIISTLDSMTKNDLKNILVKPKNSLVKQYQELFKMDDVNLFFDDEAIDIIIDEAYELKLGARGLRTICEKVLQEYMYNCPSDKKTKTININSNYVKNVLKR